MYTVASGYYTETGLAAHKLCDDDVVQNAFQRLPPVVENTKYPNVILRIYETLIMRICINGITAFDNYSIDILKLQQLVHKWMDTVV